MTTPALTDMTTLGAVKSETVSKDAGLFNMPLPGSDSTATVLLDIFGCTRTLSIEGEFIENYGGASLSVSSFLSALYGLLNGSGKSRTYTSATWGTFTGIVTRVGHKTEEGAPTKVNYTIDLMEGSAS